MLEEWKENKKTEYRRRQLSSTSAALDNPSPSPSQSPELVICASFYGFWRQRVEKMPLVPTVIQVKTVSGDANDLFLFPIVEQFLEESFEVACKNQARVVLGVLLHVSEGLREFLDPRSCVGDYPKDKVSLGGRSPVDEAPSSVEPYTESNVVLFHISSFAQMLMHHTSDLQTGQGMMLIPKNTQASVTGVVKSEAVALRQTLDIVEHALEQLHHKPCVFLEGLVVIFR